MKHDRIVNVLLVVDLLDKPEDVFLRNDAKKTTGNRGKRVLFESLLDIKGERG
jgi:hypothetical protein